MLSFSRKISIEKKLNKSQQRGLNDFVQQELENFVEENALEYAMIMASNIIKYITNAPPHRDRNHFEFSPKTLREMLQGLPQLGKGINLLDNMA